MALSARDARAANRNASRAEYIEAMQLAEQSVRERREFNKRQWNDEEVASTLRQLFPPVSVDGAEKTSLDAPVIPMYQYHLTPKKTLRDAAMNIRTILSPMTMHQDMHVHASALLGSLPENNVPLPSETLISGSPPPNARSTGHTPIGFKRVLFDDSYIADTLVSPAARSVSGNGTVTTTNAVAMVTDTDPALESRIIGPITRKAQRTDNAAVVTCAFDENTGNWSVTGSIATHERYTWDATTMFEDGGAIAQLVSCAGRPVVQPITLGLFATDNKVVVYLPRYNKVNWDWKPRLENSHPLRKRKILSQVLNGMYGTVALSSDEYDPYRGYPPPVVHMSLTPDAIAGIGRDYRVTGFHPKSMVMTRQLYSMPFSVQEADGLFGSDESSNDEITESSVVSYRDTITSATGWPNQNLDRLLTSGTWATDIGYEHDVRSMLSHFRGVTNEVIVHRANATRILSELDPVSGMLPYKAERIEREADDEIRIGSTTRVKFQGMVCDRRNIYDVGFANEIRMMTKLKGKVGFMESYGFASSHTMAFVMYPEDRYDQFVFPSSENQSTEMASRVKCVLDLAAAVTHIREMTGSFSGIRVGASNTAETGPKTAVYFHGGITPDTIFWDKRNNQVALGGLGMIGVMDYRQKEDILVAYLHDEFETTGFPYRSPYLVDAINDRDRVCLLSDEHAREYMLNCDMYSVGCFALDMMYGANWVSEHLFSNGQLDASEIKVGNATPEQTFISFATAVIREAHPIPKLLTSDMYVAGLDIPKPRF